MNKQKDLINIFNFLAEYLRETPVVNPIVNQPVVNPIVNEPVSVVEESKVLGVDTTEILDLMRKVDDIQKVKTTFDEPLMRKCLPEEYRDLEETKKVETKSPEEPKQI